MAGVYTGVDNVARKVKNIYVGVDGVARKVKKNYVGVEGVARQTFNSGFFTEFVKRTLNYVYKYSATKDSGKSVIDYPNLVDGNGTTIWNRNNTLYRLVVSVTTSNTAINKLQKKAFGETEWTTLHTSIAGTNYVYTMSYNAIEDTFTFTRITNGVAGLNQSKSATGCYVYYSTNAITGSNIESTNFETISYTSTNVYNDFATMDIYFDTPVIYRCGTALFLYYKWYKYTGSGGTFYTVNGFKNNTNTWVSSATSTYISLPILFNGSFFCTNEHSAEYNGMYKITFSGTSTSNPTILSFGSATGFPPNPHSDFDYGSGRGRFFILNSKLVCVIPTKSANGSGVANIKIYTSTDGTTFTLVSSTDLPSVVGSAVVSTYLGETKDKLLFSVSNFIDAVGNVNAVFYSIDKNTLALEYEEPIVMEGMILQAVTKYE